MFTHHQNKMKTIQTTKYYPLSTYLKDKFGEKVYKITIDAGFTCPNRDGTISSKGCIFCDNGGSFSQAHSNTLTIKEQIETGIESQHARFKANKFMAYFQAYTNTYKPVEILKQNYDEALTNPKVVGLSIGTRPDCVDSEKLNLIQSYNKDYEVWIEYGMQTIHDKSLSWMNRGHDFNTFLKAYEETKSRNIKVCAHVILGLPTETKEDMLKTAEKLADLKVDGVKFHALCVMPNTELERLYTNKEINLLSEDEYVDIVCECLKILPNSTIIHRLAGNGLSSEMIAPLWLNSKWATLNKINEKLSM